ncbi:MAG TPA: hypothetical protein VJR06_04200, partial [Nitrososphaerales archaeon]|nr:hypothetical protein [Nitrososphaerales archaeon]
VVVPVFAEVVWAVDVRMVAVVVVVVGGAVVVVVVVGVVVGAWVVEEVVEVAPGLACGATRKKYVPAAPSTIATMITATTVAASPLRWNRNGF